MTWYLIVVVVAVCAPASFVVSGILESRPAVPPYNDGLDLLYYEKNEDAWLERGKQAYLDGGITVDRLEEVQAALLVCHGDPVELKQAWLDVGMPDPFPAFPAYAVDVQAYSAAWYGSDPWPVAEKPAAPTFREAR